MSLLDSNMDLNFDIKIVESICVKYFEAAFNPERNNCVVQFILNEEIDYRDVLLNPQNYILGRYLKSSLYPKKHIYMIMIFKIERTFPECYPFGTYVSTMYLDWKLNLSNIIL